MAHLSKLKFSDKQRTQVKMTVEERLCHKLIDRLKEQGSGLAPAWPGLFIASWTVFMRWGRSPGGRLFLDT